MGATVDDAYTEYFRQVVPSGRSVTGAGTIYPAQNVDLLTVDSAKYFKGLDDGVDDVVGDVRRYSKQCAADRYVLIGYSQGAMVMHRAVWKLEEIGFDLGRIDGVIAIADGDRKPSTGAREHGTVTGGDGVSYMYPKASGDRYKPRAGVPQRVRGRFHSVCITFDIVCDTKAQHFSSPALALAGVKNHEKYKRDKPAWKYVKSAVSAVAGVTKSIPVPQVTNQPTPTPTPSPTTTPPQGTPLTVGRLTLTYPSPWTSVGYGAAGPGGDSHATDPINPAGATVLLAIFGPANCYADLASCVVSNTGSLNAGPAVSVSVGERIPDSSARFIDSRDTENVVWCFSVENVCVLYRPESPRAGSLSLSAALLQLFANARWS